MGGSPASLPPSTSPSTLAAPWPPSQRSALSGTASLGRRAQSGTATVLRQYAGGARPDGRRRRLRISPARQQHGGTAGAAAGGPGSRAGRPARPRRAPRSPSRGAPPSLTAASTACSTVTPVTPAATGCECPVMASARASLSTAAPSSKSPCRVQQVVLLSAHGPGGERQAADGPPVAGAAGTRHRQRCSERGGASPTGHDMDGRGALCAHPRLSRRCLSCLPSLPAALKSGTHCRPIASACARRRHRGRWGCGVVRHMRAQGATGGARASRARAGGPGFCCRGHDRASRLLRKQPGAAGTTRRAYLPPPPPTHQHTHTHTDSLQHRRRRHTLLQHRLPPPTWRPAGCRPRWGSG